LVRRRGVSRAHCPPRGPGTLRSKEPRMQPHRPRGGFGVERAHAAIHTPGTRRHSRDYPDAAGAHWSALPASDPRPADASHPARQPQGPRRPGVWPVIHRRATGGSPTAIGIHQAHLSAYARTKNEGGERPPPRPGARITASHRAGRGDVAPAEGQPRGADVYCPDGHGFLDEPAPRFQLGVGGSPSMSISQPARSGSWGTKRVSVAVGASRSSRPRVRPRCRVQTTSWFSRTESRSCRGTDTAGSQHGGSGPEQLETLLGCRAEQAFVVLCGRYVRAPLGHLAGKSPPDRPLTTRPLNSKKPRISGASLEAADGT
jgi:hypothetical protein